MKAINMQTLVEHKSFSKCLQALIEHQKEINPDFKQSSLHELLGYRTPSAISDFISGRRKFPLAKLSLLKTALQFDHIVYEYLRLLLIIEVTKDFNAKHKLIEELRELVSFIQLPKVALDKNVKNYAFIYSVYSCFGMFDSRPTYQQILQFFGRERIVDIERSLRYLIHNRFVIKNGESFEHTDKDQRLIVSAEAKKNEAIEHILTDSFAETLRFCRNLKEPDGNTILREHVIRCKKENYLDTLKDLMMKLKKQHLLLESSSGNALASITTLLRPVCEIKDCDSKS